MRVRFEILLFANLLSAACLFGQERLIVKGEVLDNETKKPVPNVNVIVRGKKIGAVTDSSGYFRLELPTREQSVLVFSHIAYEKVTRDLSFDGPMEVEFRIYLEPRPVELQEVVVTGMRPIVLTKAAEERASWRLDGAEFERLGEQDMERAMMYFLPFHVKPLVTRMTNPAHDFTLYVNGEWKESIFLADIDPFSVRRVLVWEPLGWSKSIDIFAIGLPLHTGKFVILIETK